VSTASNFAIELPSGLLAGVRSGDLRAFERLFRLFERPVYALAVRMLGDPEEAMETLHDTFLKAHDGMAGFRGDSPFWGWLRQIAVNEALMRLRRRGALLASAVEDVAAALPDPGPSPLAHAEAAQLERAMAALPEITRSVLWLYHGEGYTHEEIAALMGRTPSFSKSQLARGTHRLRALLDDTREARHVS
jgi:RNA polymerase sigma factor (sigma-70 family)